MEHETVTTGPAMLGIDVSMLLLPWKIAAKLQFT